MSSASATVAITIVLITISVILLHPPSQNIYTETTDLFISTEWFLGPQTLADFVTLVAGEFLSLNVASLQPGSVVEPKSGSQDSNRDRSY